MWHLFILKDQKKNHATLRYSDQACAIDTWVMEFLTSNYYRTLVINLRHKSVAKSKDQEKKSSSDFLNVSRIPAHLYVDNTKTKRKSMKAPASNR